MTPGVLVMELRIPLHSEQERASQRGDYPAAQAKPGLRSSPVRVRFAP